MSRKPRFPGIEQSGPEAWYDSLTGHTFDSLEAAEHYHEREAMRRQEADEGEKILDGLSAEEMKSLVSAMAHRTQEATNAPCWDEVQTHFVASTPAYKACPENGLAMLSALRARGLLSSAHVPSLQEVRDTFYDLLEAGVPLKLNKDFGAPKRPQDFDEEAAYAMPMEELKQKVRGW